MKKILHIIKNPDDPHAVEVIASQRKDKEISVLLLQDAVRLEPSLPDGCLFVLEEDAAERGITPKSKTIGYDEMLEMILNADSVVVW
jgi:sulfur transfer complex TusBCD TusB component (DsrH family)